MKRSLHAILLLPLSLGLACAAGGSDPPTGGLGGSAAPGGGGSPSATPPGSGSTGGSQGAGAPGGGSPGGNGGSGLVTVAPGLDSGGAPSCGVQAFDRERKPVEVILVLDRSGSMEDPPTAGGPLSKWDMTIPPLRAVMQATDSAISWGIKTYPELDVTAGCAAESIVPTIHVPIAPNNAATVIAVMNATLPLGDGTPTGDAIRFALAHLRERARVSDNPKYILLATDGNPTCPEGGDPTAFAVMQIAEALAAGFPTFVVGVDTTAESSIERLNQMAVAGGRPRPRTDPNPLAAYTAFYLTSTQAALEEALRGITGELASCIFDLNPPPPVPDNIAVDFAGVRTDRDPSRQNGWEYTKADHTQLEVYGSWCDRIQNEAMNRVNIKYGCPNQPIPITR